MRDRASGKILGYAAGAGLLVVLAAFVYLRVFPPPGRGPAYDQVFKYCTETFPAIARGDAGAPRDPLYARLAALPAGDYPTGNASGHIYLFGQEMFEVELPAQLRVIRPLNGIGSWSDTDEPRTVIGCSTAALTRVLQAYELQPDDPAPQAAPDRRRL